MYKVTRWEIELDFTYSLDSLPPSLRRRAWEEDELFRKVFTFTEEEEAKALYLEAMAAIDTWDRGEPGPEMLEFPRRHDVTMWDLEGSPIGGFHNGEAVVGYTLALQDVVRAIGIVEMAEVWDSE